MFDSKVGVVEVSEDASMNDVLNAILLDITKSSVAEDIKREVLHYIADGKELNTNFTYRDLLSSLSLMNENELNQPVTIVDVSKKNGCRQGIYKMVGAGNAGVDGFVVEKGDSINPTENYSWAVGTEVKEGQPVIAIRS